MLGAYVFAAATTQFGAGAVAAAAALAITVGGFLYAWREPAPLDR